MATYYDATDSGLATWGANFFSACQAHATELQLNPAALAEIGQSLSDYTDAHDAMVTARAAAIGATTLKVEEKRAFVAVVAKFANLFQSMPTVESGLIAELGLTLRGQHSANPVRSPERLSAEGFSNGVNRLRWKANGNSERTVYVIEAAYDNGPHWIFVNTTTKTKFAHREQQPGRPVSYRVTARRADKTSAPSNVAVVYVGSSALRVVDDAA